MSLSSRGCIYLSHIFPTCICIVLPRQQNDPMYPCVSMCISRDQWKSLIQFNSIVTFPGPIYLFPFAPLLISPPNRRLDEHFLISSGICSITNYIRQFCLFVYIFIDLMIHHNSRTCFILDLLIFGMLSAILMSALCSCVTPHVAPVTSCASAARRSGFFVWLVFGCYELDTTTIPRYSILPAKLVGSQLASSSVGNSMNGSIFGI